MKRRNGETREFVKSILTSTKDLLINAVKVLLDLVKYIFSGFKFTLTFFAFITGGIICCIIFYACIVLKPNTRE